MERAVKTLQPFEFRSDFSAPAFAPAPELERLPEKEAEEAPVAVVDDGAIRLTAPELAHLLSEARAESIAEQQRLAGADDGMITLSGEELARLLSQARAEGLAENESPVETNDGLVKIPAVDLSDMLNEARAEGIAEALSQQKLEGHDRLQVVTGKLNQALANLVALAGHLEATANDSAYAETSIKLINAAAQRIIDGQGDLFGEMKIDGTKADASDQRLADGE